MGSPSWHHCPQGGEEATPDKTSQRFKGPQHWVLAVGEDNSGAGHPGAAVVNLQRQLAQHGLGASHTLELGPELRPGGGGVATVNPRPKPGWGSADQATSTAHSGQTEGQRALACR